MIGPMMGVDLDSEAGRYEARDAIAAVLARWCKSRTLAEIRAAFAGTAVLWGPFQDFAQLVREDPRASPENPLFSVVEQPGIGRYPMPGLPLDFAAAPRLPTGPAPPRPPAPPRRRPPRAPPPPRGGSRAPPGGVGGGVGGVLSGCRWL